MRMHFVIMSWDTCSPIRRRLIVRAWTCLEVQVSKGAEIRSSRAFKPGHEGPWTNAV